MHKELSDCTADIITQQHAEVQSVRSWIRNMGCNNMLALSANYAAYVI